MKWLIILKSLLCVITKSLEYNSNKVIMQTVNDIFLYKQILLNDAKLSSNETIEYIKELTKSLFESLNTFFTNESSIKALTECKESLYALYTNEAIQQFYDLFIYNGKGLSDIGFEKECQFRNYKYFKVFYELTLNQFTMKDEVEVMRFLNQSRFYTGFCLNPECKQAIDSIKENDNQALFSYLESYYHLKIQDFLHPPNNSNKPNEPFQSVFNVMIYCILGYIIFKLIITGIKITCFSSENIQLNNSNLNIELEDEEDDGMSQNLYGSNNDNNNSKAKQKKNQPQSKRKKEESIFKNKLISITMKQLPKPRNQSLLLRFINFFDIFENIQYLSSLSNNYYNDKRIALFTFVRFLLMFFLTYNHNFYTITRMPGKDFLNSDFYKSVLFCFIKITIHSSTLWVILDGATFSYKFMSSIKNNMRKSQERSVSIGFILRWWLLAIPKIISFFFIFFFFHYFIAYYKYFFPDSGTMFEYYLNKFQTRHCKEDPIDLFIPFKISYIDSTISYAYCYRFCYIYLNEIYLFIFFTLYFYIAFKIKSRVMDYLVLAITILNICLTTLSLPYYPSSTLYHINSVFGNSVPEKFLHLFLNFYMMGILIGMSYFYYYDAVSNYSLTQNEIYVPFFFCYSFVKFLDTLKYGYKKILLYVLIFLLFLDSLSFFFVRLVRQTDDNSLLFPMDAFLNIFDQYDKILVGIVFSIILVLLLLFHKETTIRNIINSNLFIPFSRISLAYFCLSNTIIYVVYCLFIIQLKLSYPNLIYVTIGLLIINGFISLIVVILFEHPFRVLIKKFIRWSGNNKKESVEDRDKILLEQINNSMKIIDD